MNQYSEDCPLTLNTTRICADNPIDTAIEVSRIGFTNMRPNAVILVNKNEVFDGIAATPIIHFPINAALLFTDCNNLSKDTLKEIQRLCPKGYKGIHVILVGNISKNVSKELNDYGFKTIHVAGRNHYETACIVPNIRKEFKNILIISGEDYSEGIIAGYWSAHHGDPILYVQKDNIPSCTLEIIKRMENINIYIIGSTKTVSKAVEKKLMQLNNVKCLDRIDGETPYEVSVNFAKYKDSETEFGWGRNYKEGHAFTFGELNNPMKIIAGILFAHMGKHTPPLLIEKDKIPKVVEKYINAVKPMPPKGMPMPPFMHGFILGSVKDISYKTQVMIENILSIDHEMNGMDNEMMGMGHEMMNMDNHMMHMHHKMMGMNNKMMNMKDEDTMEQQNCMHMCHDEDNQMKDMNNQMMQMHHKKMNMEHEMEDMDDEMHEMMDMKDEDEMEHPHQMCHMCHGENEDNEMMDMHNEMMNMENGDMMKISDCMHMHHMEHDKDKESEKKPFKCKHKMSEKNRLENYNINYKTISINEILD